MHQSFDIGVIGHAILKHLLLTVMLIDRVVGFTEEKKICQRFMDLFLTSNKRRKHKMIPLISNLEWAKCLKDVAVLCVRSTEISTVLSQLLSCGTVTCCCFS